MKTMSVGGAELHYGPDPDPDQGYRIECQSSGGMRVAVFLDPTELRAFARDVHGDAIRQWRAEVPE